MMTGRADGRGMWFGVPEDALVSTVMRPAQFHDIWSRSTTTSGERALGLAVVQEALHDLAKYRFAARRRGQRLYWEAYQWVASDDRTWPFSFVNLCEGAGLSVEAVRHQVLDAPSQQAAEALDQAREIPFGKAA